MQIQIICYTHIVKLKWKYFYLFYINNWILLCQGLGRWPQHEHDREGGAGRAGVPCHHRVSGVRQRRVCCQDHLQHVGTQTIVLYYVGSCLCDCDCFFLSGLSLTLQCRRCCPTPCWTWRGRCTRWAVIGWQLVTILPSDWSRWQTTGRTPRPALSWPGWWTSL